MVRGREEVLVPTAFEVVEGTKLHRTAEGWRRATDGIRVVVVDGHVIDPPLPIESLDQLPE